MSLSVDDLLVNMPEGHLQSATYTRYIDTTNFSDDGHIDVRNMWRMKVNIHEKKLCFKLVICKEV